VSEVCNGVSVLNSPPRQGYHLISVGDAPR